MNIFLQVQFMPKKGISHDEGTVTFYSKLCVIICQYIKRLSRDNYQIRSKHLKSNMCLIAKDLVRQNSVIFFIFHNKKQRDFCQNVPDSSCFNRMCLGTWFPVPALCGGLDPTPPALYYIWGSRLKELCMFLKLWKWLYLKQILRFHK